MARDRLHLEAAGACDDDAAIRAFLERDSALHLYELGDLSQPYRASTTYFASPTPEGRIGGVVTLYEGSDLPTLLAFASDPEEHAALLTLLERMAPSLPSPLYAHLSPGLERGLGSFAVREDRGQHLKLALGRYVSLVDADPDRVEHLGPAHGAEVRAFLDASYPGHFFHERVLESGMAFGVREHGALRAFAGVHVFAPTCAALGNVATAPEARGRGHARRCLVALVEALRSSGVETIGLNVEADNAAAIGLYKKLGFETAATYTEAIYRRA